eukprot:3014591-Prymnesium_polylepis.1
MVLFYLSVWTLAAGARHAPACSEFTGPQGDDGASGIQFDNQAAHEVNGRCRRKHAAVMTATAWAPRCPAGLNRCSHACRHSGVGDRRGGPGRRQDGEEEEVLSTAAGLAKLTSTLAAVDELIDPLGARPNSQQPASITEAVVSNDVRKVPTPQCERLLKTLPEGSRNQAAVSLCVLLNDLEGLESLALQAEGLKERPFEERARTFLNDARISAQQMTKLYYAAGCVVRSDPVKSGAQTDFENSNMRLLEEPRLLHQPADRDDKVADRLGFRPDV